MNLEALTPSIEQTLNIIVSNLASFFGTTTEIIMQNAPMWLAKYGWYVTLKDLNNSFAHGILCGFSVSVIIYFYDLLIENMLSKKSVCFLIILGTICPIVIDILPAIFTPELVGLENLLALLP